MTNKERASFEFTTITVQDVIEHLDSHHRKFDRLGVNEYGVIVIRDDETGEPKCILQIEGCDLCKGLIDL